MEADSDDPARTARETSGATSALVIGWSAGVAELAAELLTLRHAAPTGSAIDRAAAGCMHGCGAHALVTEALRLLPAAPQPPTNAPELLLFAAHARAWIGTNLECASVVGRAARLGLAGGELVRAATLLLAVHDAAWIPQLRFDPLERSAAAARDGGTQLALASGHGPLPGPLARIAAGVREPLTRLAARCPPAELGARHADASALARTVIPLPWSAAVRAELTAFAADGGPGSSQAPLPPGASPAVVRVAASSPTPSLREVLVGFGAGRVAVDGVLRALIEHDGWVVHASHAIDPSAIVDGRVEVDAAELLLGVGARSPAPDAWIFTDDAGALAAQRAAGSLGLHLRRQRGVDVLRRLAARDDLASIRVNPGSPPDQGFVIGRDAFGVVGMMCTAIAFERLAASRGAGDAAIHAAFLALPGVATLRRKADLALRTISGATAAPLARAAVGFTTPDVARAFFEHLPPEVREALEQVVPPPQTLAEVALDEAGTHGLVLNPLGPGRAVLGRGDLRQIVGRDAAPPRAVRWRHVFTDRERRFALDVDESTGATYVSFPVRSSKVEYDEYYAVDRETFARYEADPSLAHDLVARAKRRELDHLLLFPPGSERGEPDEVPPARARLVRDRLHYSVGSERSPADPFGRSRLVIEVDGRARLDQHTRSGHSAWTGCVTSSALRELWGALEEAGFPRVPRHAVPAGSAIRDLNVGGPDGPSVYVAYHAAAALPGYRIAFDVLDTVIRQISEDTVRVVPPSDVTMVEAVARAPG